MGKYIKRKVPGLFDQEFREQELRSRKKGILVLDDIVDWEAFREMVERAVVREWKGNQGRPMFAPLQMFKVLVIQNYYHLSDERMEEMLLDSESFKIFAGFSYGDTFPDQKTIWRFREQLKNAGVFEKAFLLLQEKLKRKGITGQAGVMIDAAFVEVPRQHDSKTQKAKREEGNKGEEPPLAPNVLRQKDMDAKWGGKHGEHYFGYKVHIKADVATRFVMAECLTPANVSDKHKITELVEGNDGCVYADKGYAYKDVREELIRRGAKPMILEKGTRGHPLQAYQKEVNRLLSSIRARVEHVFGDISTGMQGFFCRYKKQERVHAASQLRLLLYNFRRLAFYRLSMAKLDSMIQITL